MTVYAVYSSPWGAGCGEERPVLPVPHAVRNVDNPLLVLGVSADRTGAGNAVACSER